MDRRHANLTYVPGAEHPQLFARVGAAAAPVGAVVLFVSTLLHPMSVDPNDAAAAFAEYAADPFYVWSHMGQFVGFVRFYDGESGAMVSSTSALESSTFGGLRSAWTAQAASFFHVRF